MWPRFKTKFLDDLSRLFESTGPWDAVLFSGDLTQQAQREEFDRLDQVLEELWNRFRVLGASPTLVTVPGNHDLVWPAPLDAVMLQPYWQAEVLRNGLFDGSAFKQTSVIEAAFAAYRDWRALQIKSGRHALPMKDGVMPGDASYRIAFDAGHVGIVALNSTWLHLAKGNFQGSLAVDVRQLLAVTDQDADEWCNQNDGNLLMTHHPTDWLHPEARDHWRSDINPPGRFDLHLFGHMHEQDFATVSRGGGGESRNAQASALFGLEYLSDRNTQRIQGYSANCLLNKGNDREITVWPRVLTKLRDGSQDLTPDIALGLKDGVSFTKRYPRTDANEKSASTSINESTPSVTLERSAANIASELEKIRYFISNEPAHRSVRRLELHRVAGALEHTRIAWIAADWGMGEDGFLSAVQAHFNEIGMKTYRFDLSEYQTREQFLNDSQTRFGASFETLCENISTVGPSYVLFNDVPVGRSTAPGEMPVEHDIEALAKILTEFASGTKVLLRAQRPPRNGPQFVVAELKALDEADVAIYLRDSDQAGDALSKPEKVSQIFRLTDGVPSRIDNALRELEVTSLDDLLSANSDLGSTALTVLAPQALVSAVGELEASADLAEQRAFDLLKAIAALPAGEQLSQIARLNGPIPFRPAHAIDLTSRALLDSAPLMALGAEENATSKALVVPRPVREYVRSRLSEAEVRSLDRKLLTLYFGEGWNKGKISGSRAGRCASNSLCPMHEIVNANTLIVRYLRRAVEDESSDNIDTAVALASAFIECLSNGSHYRGALSLCDDAMHLIPKENRERQLTILQYERARALRMTNNLEEVRDALEALDYNYLSQYQRQSAKLNLALAYRSLSKADDAKRVARDCIAIDRKSALALQAESIVATQIADSNARVAKLTALRAKSDRQKSAITTNNIALNLSDEAENRQDFEEARRLLREVVDRARREGDFYNGARAIANLAKLHPLDAPFAAADKIRLIDAYHFAHNERRGVLFDQCHEALWNVFEREQDIGNLLSLFRHSSFIWRINGREKREIQYIERLRALRGRMLQPSRDREYFYVRVTIILGIQPGGEARVLPN